MAAGDFFVTFGSNLPKFLEDTKSQVKALDTAIKGIGGAFANLADVDIKDVEKLDNIARALQGGASISIDTKSLDSSIKKLERTLADQLKTLSSGLSGGGGEVKAPDMAGVSEAFKNIKPGELKRQAGFLAKQVRGLQEKTSETRASFLSARTEAGKTQKHARAITNALIELNDKLENAATILNRARIDPPDAPADGGGGGGAAPRGRLEVNLAAGPPIPVTIVDKDFASGGFPGAAAFGGDTGAQQGEDVSSEELAKSKKRKTKVVDEAANKLRLENKALEDAIKARRDELVMKRHIQQANNREAEGKEATESQRKKHEKAVAGVAAAEEKRKELVQKLTAEQRKEFDRLNQSKKSSDDNKQAVDRLGAAYRSLRDERLKEAKAAKEATAKTRGAAQPAAQAGASARAEAPAAAQATPTALDDLAAAAEGAANKVDEGLASLFDDADQRARESGETAGKQIADGVVEEFKKFIVSMRPEAEEREAMDKLSDARQSGARGLDPELNQALTSVVGMSEKMPMELAKSLEQIAVEVESERFIDEMTKVFRNLPELLRGMQQEGAGIPTDDIESLVSAFPEGVPEEAARVLAESLRESAGSSDEFLQAIRDQLQEIAQLLSTQTDDRAGSSFTTSAVRVGSQPEQREYGAIFGATQELRNELDQAVVRLGEFRERTALVGKEFAVLISGGLQPDLDPLKDIPALETPPWMDEFQELLKRMRTGRDSEGQDAPLSGDDQERFRELSTLNREFKQMASEWERGKLKLQEYLVALDEAAALQRDQAGNLSRMSAEEVAFAAARKESLDAKRQEIAAARDEAQARRDVIQAGDERLRRISVDPNFRDTGRTLPALDARRDFPGSEDTVDFAKQVDEFNKKRAEWLKSIVDAIDIGEGPEQDDAFKKIDSDQRKLFGELDALYAQRNSTIEDELEAQRANLEGLKRGNAGKKEVARLEAEVAELEEQAVEIQRRRQAIAAKKELGEQVPLDPQLAVGVQRQKFQQQVESDVPEGIFATAANMLQALEEAEGVAERLSKLADQYFDLEVNKNRNLEEVAKRRAAAEAQYNRTVEELANRGGERTRTLVGQGSSAQLRVQGEVGPQIEDAKAWAQAQMNANKEAGAAAEEYERKLEELEQEMREADETLQRFKAAFGDLFRGRGEMVQRPTGERDQLGRELKDVVSQIKQLMADLPEGQREQVERRDSIRADLGRKEGDRVLDGDRVDLTQELREIERELREVLRPIDELANRRDAIQQSLRLPDRRESQAATMVGPEDFREAARLFAEEINKAIGTMLGRQFTGLDQNALSQAANVETQGTPQATLDAAARKLEEVVVLASQRAMERLTETTTTTAAGERSAAQTGADEVGSGEIRHVRDQDAISHLAQIESGIRELVECCRRMADGLGATPTTATQRQGAAAASSSGGAEQLALFGENIVAAANRQEGAATKNEAAAKQQEASAKALLKGAARYRQDLEQKLGTVFQGAEDMLLALLEGEGGVRPRSPKMATREAAEAFGIDRASEAFEELDRFSRNAADALYEETQNKRVLTKDTKAAADAEAKRTSRMRQLTKLGGEYEKTLGPLLQGLFDLERQLEDVSDASEKARVEEELRAKRLQFRQAAQGPNLEGGGVVPRGNQGRLLVQRLIGGQKAYQQAGEEAGTQIQKGMEGGFQRGGAFSFIDRTLQTTVTFFIRSMASTLTFGVQRQLRQLVSIGLETEATFIRVSSAMEATNRSSQGLRQEITRISTTLGVSLQELFELSARFTGVFEDPMDVVRATEAVALLEIISQGQLNAIDGYRSMSAIQNSFFKDLEELGKTGAEAFEFITDSTVAIQDLTGVNIEDLLEGAASLGGVTQPLNFGLLETEALVGKVAQSIGQTGTAAAEQLGRIFANVTSPRFQEELLAQDLASQAQILERDFKSIFEQIAVADLDESNIRNLAEIVGGDRQFRAAMALFSQAPDIVDTYTAAADSAGRADERRADLMKELSNQLLILGTNVENIVATFVRSGFLNVIQVVVRGLNLILTPMNQLLTALNDLADRNIFARMIRSATGLAAGFGAVLLVVRAMRNELATFFRLGTAQTAGAAAGAAGAAAGAAQASPRGMAGIFQRGSRGVQRVEIDNVRDLREAMRVRHAARARGETPTEVARRIREGELTHQRLGIGESGVADVITKSLPRQALERTEQGLNKMTVALMRKQGQLSATAAATMASAHNNSLLAKAQSIAAGAAGRLAWATAGLNRAMTTAMTVAARFGHGLIALGRTFFNQLAVVGLLGTAAFALNRHMKDARETIEELVSFRFPDTPDLDDEELGIAEQRNRIEEEFERWQNPPKFNIFRGDFWANLWDRQFLDFFNFGDPGGGRLTPEGEPHPGGPDWMLWLNEPLTRWMDDAGDTLKDGWKSITDRFRSDVDEDLAADVDFQRALGFLRDRNRDALREFDEAFADALRIEDPRERESALQALIDDLGEAVPEMVDSERTRRGKSTALEAGARLQDQFDEALGDTLRIIRGIEDFRTLSITGVERLLGVISGIESLPPRLRGDFGEQLDFIMEMEQIPEEFRGELRQLASGSGSSDAITERLLRDALASATANMEQVLRTGGSEDERKAVMSAMQAAMTNLSQFLDGQIEGAIADAEAMAEFARSRGESGVPELRQAITAAQRATTGLERGSAEWVQAQQRVRDLRRQAAEALNFEADSADMLIAELSRDPMESANARLRQAQRDLQIAQRYGDRDEVRDVELEIARIERELVDRADEVADARAALAQSRTRDPLERLVLATRDVVRRLNQARTRGAGAAELIGLERELQEALDAEADERRNIADARASLGMSRIRNPLASLQAATRDVVRRFRRASAAGEGAAVLLGLQEEYEQALFAEAEERRNLARAQEDFNVSRIRNPFQRATATARVAARRMREVAAIYGRNSSEYINAQQEFAQATDEIADTQRAIAAAQRQFGITVAEVAQLDVQAARLRLADARQSYREALSLYGAYSVEAEAARAAEEQARGGLRDAILGDATDRIEWQLSMEEITQQSALAAYQNILDTFDLTEKQRRDIMLKMKQMQDSINSAMEGQFNLGDIRIPTPFEVRRSMGLDGIQDTVTDVVSQFTEMFGSAANQLSRDLGGGLSSFGPAQTTSIANSETTILVNGADTNEVKRILTQILGTSAMGQTTVASSGSRRM